MDSPAVHRTLVVANRTAETPRLLEELQRRAAQRPTAFVLLVPDAANRKAVDWTLEDALGTVRQALRGRSAEIEGLEGEADAVAAVTAALAEGHYDDVIISTLPRRISAWLRRDLPHRVRQLGVPVTVITPPDGEGNWLPERGSSYGPRVG